ncbi:DNA (cytosine-5)-methyltransferase 1 [Microdochium nivale]|nr:DNA (cytosine-5)-methyltransferase 1 [Microdochium nivale]
MSSLIRGFTDLGYSARWGVIQLLTWGTSTQRLRLIIIGSCPGELLPTFPAPTHAATPSRGQERFVTVADALHQGRPAARVLSRDPHHQPGRLHRLTRPPWDANQFLPRTITTSGVDAKFCYPDGTRGFTPREIARLQGFPWGYRFSQKQVQKQAGNAFPPPAVQTLYEHIRKWLMRVDRVRAAPPWSSPTVPNLGSNSGGGIKMSISLPSSHLPAVMTIDDDDEDDAGHNAINGSEITIENISNEEDDDDDDDVIMLDTESLFSPALSRESTATLPEADPEANGSESPTQQGSAEHHGTTRGAEGFVEQDDQDGDDMDVVEICSWRVVGRHATRVSWTQSR